MRTLQLGKISNCGVMEEQSKMFRLAYLPTLAVLLLLWNCGQESGFAIGSQDNSIISLGSSLSTYQNVSWLSRNGTFAFGFYPVGAHTYTLSIWYAAIPEKTVVWTANRNSLVIEGATLSFGSDGNVELMDSLQVHPVWQTNTSSTNVLTAELLDSGNFVLRDAQLEVVWESFSFPSDTLLPDQMLTVGGELVSAQTNGNAAPGRYALRQDDANLDGNLRLYYLPSYTNYWSATPDNYSDTSFEFSYLNQSGIFGLYNDSGSVLASWMTTDVGPGPLRHLKLGVGGDLRIYSWFEKLETWVVVWKALSDECSVINLCGPYGLCRYEPEPICTCPPQFSLVDPQDYSQGCQPAVPLNCSTGSAGQQFLKLDNAQYQSEAYITLQGISEVDCMSRCSEDCACLGIFYFYNGNGTCSLKSQQHTAHVDPTGNSYVKINALINLTDSTTGEGTGIRRQRRVVRPEIVAAIVCGFSLACFLLTGCCYHWWKEARIHRHRGLGKWTFVDYIAGSPTRFSLTELQTATLDFSMQIGAGDFGSVYKGVLPDGSSVAVKQLETVSTNPPSDKVFREQVAIVANTHHQNCVRLYGFCSEGSANRFLVYELMPNGSIDKFIFTEMSESEPTKTKKLAQMIVIDSHDQSCSSGSTRERANCMDWKKRFKAILSTARGIAYLHEQCRESILHGQVNPDNILLDDQFEAKVSNFGIAKLMTQKAKEQAKVLTTSVRGDTRNYLAPECFSSNLLITTKTDVYSFGMVVIEIVTSRKLRAKGENPSSQAAQASKLLLEWGFYRAVAQGELTELVDKRLGRKFSSVEVERALKVAAWCVQDEPASRPSMSTVVHMLEGLVIVPSPSISKPLNLKNSGAVSTVEPSHAASQRSSSDIEAVTSQGPQNRTGSLDDGSGMEFDLNSPLISRME